MTNLPLLVYVAIFVLLFIPYWLLMPTQPGFELLDAAAAALGIGALSTYWGETWEALKRKLDELLSSHYVVTGVFFGVIEMALLFGGMLIWRAKGQPPDIINSAPIMFTRWLAVMTLGFFMLTTYSNRGIIAVAANRSPTIISLLAFFAILWMWWFLS